MDLPPCFPTGPASPGVRPTSPEKENLTTLDSQTTTVRTASRAGLRDIHCRELQLRRRRCGACIERPGVSPGRGTARDPCRPSGDARPDPPRAPAGDEPVLSKTTAGVSARRRRARTTPSVPDVTSGKGNPNPNARVAEGRPVAGVQAPRSRQGMTVTRRRAWCDGPQCRVHLPAGPFW